MGLKGEATRMEIITAIRMYNSRNGFAPSVRDICKLTGIKSTSTVHRHLEILKHQGRLDFSPTMPRTITITSKKQPLL